MNQAVTAKLNFLRMSPRKARLVVDLIRGRRVAKALEILTLSNKLAARPIMKLLNSAIANAKHNFKLGPENLVISTIMVDGGPMLKRWMPKAHGRATPIRERTSHISLILTEVAKPVKKVKKTS
ncbi:MAG: 50S ribosomal protein L22 [Candidatus Magasanikbacteria bacterium]